MIILPFPPSALSGHANGNSHWGKSNVTKEWRELSVAATNDSKVAIYADDGKSDIGVHVSFYPPDRRSDRANFCNRMKPIFDGIAQALGVTDKRFVPDFNFCPVSKSSPRVEVRLAYRPGIIWGEAV